MLPVETLEEIERLARQAATPEVVELDRRTVLVREGGLVREHTLPWPPRTTFLDGVSDVLRLCRDAVIAPAPEVYHDREAVYVLLNREQRDQFAVMPLEQSDRFAKLVELEDSRKTMNVKEVNNLLRFDLHGTGVEDTLRALSKVQFGRTSTGSASAGHGKESLGRSVELEVQQADKVPEQFAVETPLYGNDGIYQITGVKVRCGVRIDLEEFEVQVVPLADQIRNAFNVAHRAIDELLSSELEGITVLAGRPWRKVPSEVAS